MTIPKEKQVAFLQYYRASMEPTWLKYGATKCVISRTNPSGDEFVELIFLKEGISADSFFASVKADVAAWDISRQYESRFSATNIVRKTLKVA